MAKVKAKSISFPNALLSTPNVCRVKTWMPVLCGWGWYCEDQWTVTKWIMEHKSNRTLLKSFRCYLLSHRKFPSYFTVNEQKNAALHTVFVRLFVKDGVSLCALTTPITLWFSIYAVFVAVTGGEVGKLWLKCVNQDSQTLCLVSVVTLTRTSRTFPSLSPRHAIIICSLTVQSLVPSVTICSKSNQIGSRAEWTKAADAFMSSK